MNSGLTDREIMRRARVHDEMLAALRLCYALLRAHVSAGTLQALAAVIDRATKE